MKQLIVGQYRRFRQLLLYGVIGLSGAILDFLVYALLAVSWGFAPWLATIISSSVGSVNNFFFNARYNFRVNDRQFFRFAAYYLVSAVGVGANAIGVYLLHDVARIGTISSKLLVAVPVVLAQYFLNSRFTFAQLDEIDESV